MCAVTASHKSLWLWADCGPPRHLRHRPPARPPCRYAPRCTRNSRRSARSTPRSGPVALQTWSSHWWGGLPANVVYGTSISFWTAHACLVLPYMPGTPMHAWYSPCIRQVHTLPRVPCSEQNSTWRLRLLDADLCLQSDAMTKLQKHQVLVLSDRGKDRGKRQGSGPAARRFTPCSASSRCSFSCSGTRSSRSCPRWCPRSSSSGSGSS